MFEQVLSKDAKKSLAVLGESRLLKEVKKTIKKSVLGINF
jgi:hypothetical protein